MRDAESMKRRSVRWTTSFAARRGLWYNSRKLKLKQEKRQNHQT